MSLDIFVLNIKFLCKLSCIEQENKRNSQIHWEFLNKFRFSILDFLLYSNKVLLDRRNNLRFLFTRKRSSFNLNFSIINFKYQWLFLENKSFIFMIMIVFSSKGIFHIGLVNESTKSEFGSIKLSRSMILNIGR